MRFNREWQLALSLIVAIGFAAPALAQQSETPESTAPSPAAAPKKHHKPKPVPPPAEAVTAAGGAKPTLLGQYGDWGAYTASPGGKKVCFAIAKPSSSQTSPPGRSRHPAYMFISSRPADKVSNEVSIIIGYSFKPSSEATAQVGATSFALATQQDGAWLKNESEDAHMVEAMRGGQSAIVKGVSSRGTQSTDTFSLRGLAQALDRSDQECK